MRSLQKVLRFAFGGGSKSHTHLGLCFCEGPPLLMVLKGNQNRLLKRYILPI